MSSASSSSRVVGMYYVISLELFRILYVRLQAGRRTVLFFFATAATMFVLITFVRMVPRHIQRQIFTMIVASRSADHSCN